MLEKIIVPAIRALLLKSWLAATLTLPDYVRVARHPPRIVSSYVRELPVCESVNSERLSKALAATASSAISRTLNALSCGWTFPRRLLEKICPPATLGPGPPAHQPFKRATLILFRQGYGPVDLECAGYGGHAGIGLTSSDTDFILTCGNDRIPSIGHHAEIAWL